MTSVYNVIVEKTVPHLEGLQKGHLYKRRNKFTFNHITQAQYPSSIWGFPCVYAPSLSFSDNNLRGQILFFFRADIHVLFTHCSPHVSEGLKQLSKMAKWSKGLC